MSSAFLSRNNIDQEIKHVTLCKGSGDITSLQSPSLIVLCVDPCTHGQLCDEDIASFGEENRSLGGDHFDFGVGLHNLLDAGKRQLMDLEIVSIGLEVVDGLLPVGGKDFARRAGQALIDLD